MEMYIDGLLLVQEMQKKAGFKHGMKMFNYLRYALRMFPPPIKSSDGKGVIAFYPQPVLTYLKQIMQERKKGLKYPEIKKLLAKEMEEVFAETERLRRQLEASHQARSELSASLRDPKHNFVVYPRKGKAHIIGEVKIQSIKEDLKKDFQSWDGKSLDKLTSIRQKIENLETLQIKQQVAKAIFQEV